MSHNPPSAPAMDALIAFARSQSPFYQRLYADQPATPAFADLPVIDPASYWQAHNRDRREVLTGPHTEGFVLNSGGTTGAPKYSYGTAREWDAAVELSARSFDAAGLCDGDRVATLFASGNLYASLMFATESLKRAHAKVVQFPIGYSVAFAEIAKVLGAFQINVLAGFPTHLLRVIDALESEGPNAVRIERIIYAGELFSQEQRDALQGRFPGLQIHSAGYASVESGPIGYADAGCAAGEHRAYDQGTIVEILDEETDLPIEETERPGRIVSTNLIRRLMPHIRFPTGDRAQWVDPAGAPDRKFLLLGRAGQVARVAGYNLDLAEVAAWIEPLCERLGVEQFQLVVTRVDLLDQMTFRLVGRETAGRPEGGEELVRAFRQRRPDIFESVDAGVLHPPKVEWVGRDELIVSERTGKMLGLVDRRNG